MDNVWQFLGLCLSLELVDICNGYPLNPSTLAGGGVPGVTWASLSPLLSVVLLFCSVLLVFGCLCCRRTKGFQEFTDSGSTPNLSTPTGGYVNNAASTEFPLFPPPQPVNQSVRFEPLPEIVPPNRSKKPAAFNNAVSHGLSEQDWFAEGPPGVDFPRQQLTYVREAGRGWFGRVVEGNAQHIVTAATTTPVVVKILRDDASPTDQMFFLHEVRAYRDLRHANVLRMLGRCLEADPFLVLLEACPAGDLKSFLCQNISTARALSEDGVTLNMACNIAAGLEHMLDHGFVHTDLAARNCLVTPDLSVKIGDYGHSIESFKEDYYIAGDVALPVRWCAPETVYCTDTIIQTKEVTPAANVWSLGVVLWEIAEFGKLPFGELTDDEVVCQVFGESEKRLPRPSLPAPHRDNLYLLMKLCWSEVEVRPALKQVHSMLQHLNASRERHQLDGQESSLCTEEDFNRRWETFKPNTIPKRDDHDLADPEPTETTPAPAPNDPRAALGSPLHLALDDHDGRSISQGSTQGAHDVFDRITPSTTSPQLSLASSYGGEFFGNALQSKDRSASLQNLRGSLEDLGDNAGQWDEGKRKERKIEDADAETDRKKRGVSEAAEKVVVGAVGSGMEPDFDSWLKGVETTDEEEAKFVAKISEAIRDLDDALALEKTSSSSSEASSKQQTPVKEFRPSEQNSVLDFRLGRMVAKEREESSEDSLRNSNSSDTEEETWRRRIERGEFSEKVKEKSKSVADLMVLTHIDPSDGSDSEPPSLTWSFERGSVRTSLTRNSDDNSFSKPKRDPNRNAALVSNSFGSEGDIHKAVLGEEFLESLQKIQLAKRDGNRNVLSEVASFLEREKMYQESITPLIQTDIDFLPTNHNREANFLAFEASGQQPSAGESRTVSPDSFCSEEPISDSEESTPRSNIKQEMASEFIFSPEQIQHVDMPILSKQPDTGTAATECVLDSAAFDETILNVTSASGVADDGRGNSPHEKTEVAFRSQVPELHMEDNVAKSLESDSHDIKSVNDGKTTTVVCAVTRVEIPDESVSDVVDSGFEIGSVSAIPEIVIDAPRLDVEETPATEVVARKPVPLPRRTLRIRCEDPRVSPEDKSVRREESELPEGAVELTPKECPPFYTSTPCAPKPAPRSVATDFLLCNVSEIAADRHADDSTDLSNCSGLSWDDTTRNFPGVPNEKPNLIERRLDSKTDADILGPIEGRQDLAVIKHPNRGSFQEPVNSHVNNTSIVLESLNKSLPIEVSPKTDVLPVTTGQTLLPRSTSCDAGEPDQNKRHGERGGESRLTGTPGPVMLDQSSVDSTGDVFPPSENGTVRSDDCLSTAISHPSSSKCYDGALQDKVVSEETDAFSCRLGEPLPTTCSQSGEQPETLPAYVTSSPNDTSIAVQEFDSKELGNVPCLSTALSIGGVGLLSTSIDKEMVPPRQNEQNHVNEGVGIKLSQRLSGSDGVNGLPVLASQQCDAVHQEKCLGASSSPTHSCEVEVTSDETCSPDFSLNICDVHLTEQGTEAALAESLLLTSSREVITEHVSKVGTVAREESSPVTPNSAPSSELPTDLAVTQAGVRQTKDSCTNKEAAADPCSSAESVPRAVACGGERPLAGVTSMSSSNSVSSVQHNEKQCEESSGVSTSLEEFTSVPVKAVPTTDLENIFSNHGCLVESLSNVKMNDSKEDSILDCGNCKEDAIVNGFKEHDVFDAGNSKEVGVVIGSKELDALVSGNCKEDGMVKGFKEHDVFDSANSKEVGVVIGSKELDALDSGNCKEDGMVNGFKEHDVFDSGNSKEVGVVIGSKELDALDSGNCKEDGMVNGFKEHDVFDSGNCKEDGVVIGSKELMLDCGNCRGDGMVNGFKEYDVLDSGKCKEESVPVVCVGSTEHKPAVRHSDPRVLTCDGSDKVIAADRAEPITAVTTDKPPALLATRDCESNSSTHCDLNQSFPKGEALVQHCYVNSQEPSYVTNDAILNVTEDVSKYIEDVTHGLNDHKRSVQDFLVNERVQYIHEMPAVGEDMSLSICGGKDQSQDVLSSVILGPCEEFTLEYFKGLKTTFPDSDSKTSDRELNGDNKSSFVLNELDDTNIDYSINGWDEFLGKTLENQDHSQYEDVTFPSLVIEHGPTQTARNIENIFESITDLQSEVTATRSPAVARIEASTSPGNVLENTSPRAETENRDGGKPKGIPDLVLQEAENTSGSRDGAPKTVDESSQDRSNPEGFSPPGFHDVLGETDEDVDELAEFALDVKHCTPDDERSSDSGFRDKGSLSESCEDACDEKYNLEDIEAELEETFNQGGFNYKLEDDESEAFQAQDRFASPEPPVEVMKSLQAAENFDGSLEDRDFQNNSPICEIEKLPANHLESSSSQTIPSSLSVSSIPLDSQSTSLFKPHLVDEYLEGSHIVNYISENEILGDNNGSPLHNELDSRSSLQVKKDLQSSDLDRRSLTENVGVSDNSVNDGNCCVKDGVESDIRGQPSSTRLAEKTSPTKRSGWYLHPPDGSQAEPSDDFLSPKSESSTSSRHDDSENSYVSYHLDEEYVTAIRNELREKLPCANQSLDSDSEEDLVDEEEGAEDRQDILIHYNMYPAPLSPILEERESVSSLDYSPYVNSLNLDSDPESLVFSLDSQEEVKKELESRKFEEDIREALESVSYESSTSSSDRDPNTTVLLEDLDKNAKQKVIKIRGTSAEVEDDVLFVDTETNEVSLVESAIPKLQLAFVNKRTIDQPAVIQTPDFVRDEETLAVDSGTFVISKSRFDQFEGSSDTSPASSAPDHAIHADINGTQQKKVGELPEKNGDNVMNVSLEQTTNTLHADNRTPDSVSPTTASDRTIPSADMEDISDFYPTPPSDVSPARRPPYPTPTVHRPEVKSPAVTTRERTNEPTFEVVRDISLNFANNEAADIIADLRDCGIIGKTDATSGDDDVVHVMTGEIYDYQDSTESSDDKYSPRSLEDDFEEMISFEEYSQSSESREYNAPTPESQMSLEFARSKPDFGGDMSPVRRLDFLTTSMGILSERNEDCFDDELERTLKLNDLGNILKLNSNSSQEGKSLPSPNINPSAKEIIVNFVKSNKQHLELLSNHPEENMKLNHLEELNNECNSSDSSNKVMSCESVTRTNQINELSHELSAFGCKLESDQTSSSPGVVSKQEETQQEHISKVSSSLQDVEHVDLLENSSECVSEDISRSVSGHTTHFDEDVACQDLKDCSSDGNEDSSSEVKSVINVVLHSHSNASDDTQSAAKECTKHDVKEKTIKESCIDSSLEVASVEDCSVQNLAKQIVFLEGSKENVGPSTKSRHLANKSGHAGEVTSPDDIRIELKSSESSLEDWSRFMGSTRAPMPSPEEESRSHPSSSALARSADRRAFDLSSSMLGFGDVGSSPDGGPSSGDSKNSPLAEVPFDPDISTSMLGFSDEKGSKTPELSFTGPGYDDGEMSTSFSTPGEEEEEEEYAPDWESDSEGSSSSGEFIWREGEKEESQPQLHASTRYLNKPYDCLPEFPMEAIAEEDEDEEDDDDDDDEDSSVGSGTEFVPSAWDSQATPSRSALRSPDKKTDVKKNVWFKKQKYHCVYEYPRENSDTESEASETGLADNQSWRPNAVDQTNQLWRSPTVGTPTKNQGSWQPAVVDYAAYADWEVTDGDGAEQDTDTESDNQVSQMKAEPFDFYKLSNVDYDFSTGVMSEDGEFFISSSARPFQQLNVTPSTLFSHSSSQFFPGQTLEFPTTGDNADRPPAVDSFADEIDTSPRNIAAPKTSPLVSSDSPTDDTGEERAGVGDVPGGQRTEDARADACVVNDESKDLEESEKGTTSATPPSSDGGGEGTAKADRSEREFPDCGRTPPSPLSPTGLGELRHTRDRLKLNLPSTNAAGKWGRGPEADDADAAPFPLDAPGKRGRTVLERGEASLLDSGEDTEDSGIESSNGMSATMTLKTTLEENLNGALANAH